VDVGAHSDQPYQSQKPLAAAAVALSSLHPHHCLLRLEPPIYYWCLQAREAPRPL